MPYLLAGFALALLAVLAALPLAAAIDPLGFPDIRLVCDALGETAAECSRGALEAGVVSAAGLAIAALIAFGLRRPASAPPQPEIRHDIVLPLALAAVGLLVAAALVGSSGVPFVSREADITANASLVSIVNLGWPLLVQLAVLARRLEVRLGYLAALATLLCLSPFRAALVAVVVFAVLLPAWGGRRFATALVAAAAALALLAGLVLLQTSGREVTPSVQAEQGTTAIGTGKKLAQRVAYPLYQAHFAAAVAETEELPGALDELAAKFRLGSSPSLNHQLFWKVYGRDTVEEMTSLYYGEAAARTASPPFFWVVAAPLLYVLAWLFFARLGADVAALAGLAIWRGSLGGAFSVLPAFLIQALVLLVLSRALRERAAVA